MKIWKFGDKATIGLFAKLAPGIKILWGIGTEKWAIVLLRSAKEK